MGRIIECPGDTFLKEYLLKNGYKIRTLCGGRGNCGKCAVKILEGDAVINTMDRFWFSEEQLSEGWRLGCQVFTKGPVRIELEETGS